MNKKISHLLLVTTALLWSSLAQAQTATIQSKQYEDGGYYEGTFKNGRQHGQGTYSL
ncbi:2-isopropylmalate synthase, partial [Planktomarina temperata]|nr:2-isopropylmalate synthase [Planktomarina temperata]